MPVGVTGKQLAHKYRMTLSKGKLGMFSRICRFIILGLIYDVNDCICHVKLIVLRIVSDLAL